MAQRKAGARVADLGRLRAGGGRVVEVAGLGDREEQDLGLRAGGGRELEKGGGTARPTRWRTSRARAGGSGAADRAGEAGRQPG